MSRDIVTLSGSATTNGSDSPFAFLAQALRGVLVVGDELLEVGDDVILVGDDLAESLHLAVVLAHARLLLGVLHLRRTKSRYIL